MSPVSNLEKLNSLQVAHGACGHIDQLCGDDVAPSSMKSLLAVKLVEKSFCAKHHLAARLTVCFFGVLPAAP